MFKLIGLMFKLLYELALVVISVVIGCAWAFITIPIEIIRAFGKKE